MILNTKLRGRLHALQPAAARTVANQFAAHTVLTPKLQLTQFWPQIADTSTAVRTREQVVTFQRDFWSKGLIW